MTFYFVLFYILQKIYNLFTLIVVVKVKRFFMKAKKLSIAKLSFDERQAIVDAIKEHDYLHKDIILELFSFVEILLNDLNVMVNPNKSKLSQTHLQKGNAD